MHTGQGHAGAVAPVPGVLLPMGRQLRQGSVVARERPGADHHHRQLTALLHLPAAERPAHRDLYRRYGGQGATGHGADAGKDEQCGGRKDGALYGESDQLHLLECFNWLRAGRSVTALGSCIWHLAF